MPLILLVLSILSIVASIFRSHKITRKKKKSDISEERTTKEIVDEEVTVEKIDVSSFDSETDIATSE